MSGETLDTLLPVCRAVISVYCCCVLTVEVDCNKLKTLGLIFFAEGKEFCRRILLLMVTVD